MNVWSAMGLAGLLAIGAVGCGVSMAQVPPLAVSVSPGDPAVFERIVTVMRSRGYVLVSSDPSTGVFTVSAQRRARPSENVVFTVQCYRNGFVEIVPSGPRVERRGDVYVAPSSIVEEYRDLALALNETIHGTSGARP